jgi:hypothetical protein
MNGGGESSSGIVPRKQPNEDLGRSKEAVEGRPLAKKNTDEPNLCRTQSRESETNGPDVCGRQSSLCRYIQGGNRVR